MVRASIPWTVKQVAKMVTNDTLRFENAIQRGFVWDKKRMSMLIDSILKNYPIPPFYTIKTGDTDKDDRGRTISIYDCLDGKQRCNTIAKFKNNEFKLSGLEAYVDDQNMELDINGMTYDDLPDDLKDAFDSYTLNCISFSDVTEDEIVEIMARLNNGKALSAMELTRIKAMDLTGLRELANHKFFKEFMTEASINKYHNEDIIAKTEALIENNDTGLDNTNIKSVYANTDFSANKDLIKGIFDDLFTIMKDISDINDDETKGKKIVKKLTGKVNLLSCIQFMLQNNLPVETYEKFFIHFFHDTNKLSCREDYNTACAAGSNHAANVKARFEAMTEEYDEFTALPFS